MINALFSFAFAQYFLLLYVYGIKVFYKKKAKKKKQNEKYEDQFSLLGVVDEVLEAPVRIRGLFSWEGVTPCVLVRSEAAVDFGMLLLEGAVAGRVGVVKGGFNWDPEVLGAVLDPGLYTSVETITFLKLEYT